MKKYLFIILVFLFSMTVMLAGETADSLLKVLDNAQEKDKPAILNALTKEFLNPSGLEQAEEYARQALTTAEKINNRKEEADAIKNLGAIAYYRKDYKKALEFYEKSLVIKQQLGDKEGSAALFFNIGVIHRNEGWYERAIEKYEQSLKIYEELKDTAEMASTYQVIGISYFYWSKFDEAVRHYEKSLKMFNIMGDEKGIADCNQLMGVIYHERGEYEKALKYNQDALRLFEKMEDPYRVANSLMNIGIVYKDWGNYHEKAKQYFEKALELMTSTGNIQGVAYALTNLGSLYEGWGENLGKDSIYKHDYFKKAIEYHEQALAIEDSIGDLHGKAGTLQSIGSVYGLMENHTKSLDYNHRALAIREELGDFSGIAESYHAIGILYNALKDFDNALGFCKKSLQLAKEMKKLPLVRDSYHSLSIVYRDMGSYKMALDYYKKFTEVKDSLVNIESHRQIAEMEEKYETEKKEQQIKLLAKEKEVKELDLKKKDEENKRQRIFIYGSGLVLIIILIFSVLLFRQLRQKKKANLLLAAKNREISDSIHYASRIQSAILPPKEFIMEVLPEHFILDKPRDIVSGDFYWLARKEEKILVAVADCTGHGVPGAFMSMLGVAFLNEIVNRYNDISAGEVLDLLRKNVIKSLHQTGKEGEATDGMDIAFCILDRNIMQLQYAGANNPIYLISKNGATDDDEKNKQACCSCTDYDTLNGTCMQNQSEEADGESYILCEVKADKMPISIHTKADQSFTNNILDICAGDLVYLFSDGFADQFGGEKGKKFKVKQFKEIIKDINHQPLESQRQFLDSYIENWKGELEQVDDILVMGIRIY